VPVCNYHTQDYLLAPVYIYILYNDSALSLFLAVSAEVEEFPSSFSRGSYRKTLSLPFVNEWIANTHAVLLTQCLITTLATLPDIP